MRCTRFSLRGIPAVRLPLVELCRRAPLALEQASPLIAAQESSELLVSIAWVYAQKTFKVPHRHAQTADEERRARHPVDGARQHVQGHRAHEVLAEPVALPAGPPTPVAGA